MTKIMTTIIAFDLIKSGDLSLDDNFLISEKHEVYSWILFNVYNGWG